MSSVWRYVKVNKWMMTMKVTVRAGDLTRIMQPLAKVAEKRTTIPILQHVLITAEDQTAPPCFQTTNMDMDIWAMAEAEYGYEVAEAGRITVSAKLLADFAAMLPAATKVTIAQHDNGAVLQSAGTTVNLTSYPPADFPETPDGKSVATFNVQSNALGRILGRVEHAVNKEQTRYYLNGVYLHTDQPATGEPPRLIAVATDGHRLAEASVEMPEGASKMPGVIIPRHAVQLVLNHIAQLAEPLQPVTCVISERSTGLHEITFNFGLMTITAKAIDGVFPDYQRVIPTRPDTLPPQKLTVRRASLLQAVGRMISVCSTSGSNNATGVILFAAPDSLVLGAREWGDGHAIYHVVAPTDMNVNGQPRPAKFQLRYLNAMLQAMHDKTDVEFDFGDKVDSANNVSGPVIIRQVGDATFRAVLMPMLIDADCTLPAEYCT